MPIGKKMEEIGKRLSELKHACGGTDENSTPDVLNRVIELVDVVADLAHAIYQENPGPRPAVGPSELPPLPRGSANG